MCNGKKSFNPIFKLKQYQNTLKILQSLNNEVIGKISSENKFLKNIGNEVKIDIAWLCQAVCD